MSGQITVTGVGGRAGAAPARSGPDIMRRRWAVPRVALVDLAAMAAYVAAVAMFYWRVVGLGLVPVGYDLLTYFYPYKMYLAELVRQGVVPLWNPAIFLGAPLLANIQAAAFYPPDVLFNLLPFAEALRYSVVLHVFLAAALTYLFARVSLGLSPPAAWVAGAVFAFGGFLGTQTEHVNQLHAAVWLPALLLCLERAASRRSPAAIVAGMVLLALEILAGHTQEAYYCGWALGLFSLYLAGFSGVKGLARLRPVLVLAAMGTGGAVLSAVQLLPTLELVRESYRFGGVPFAEAVFYSVQPVELLDSLLPLYMQVPYLELAGYTGVVALTLLPPVLVWRREPGYHRFFVALGLLALLLSVGSGTPLYGWLYETVPGFDLFRAPGRWLFLYDFSVAVLAGAGLEALRTGWREGDLRDWLGKYALALALGVAGLEAMRLWLGRRDVDLPLPPPWVVLTWGCFLVAGIAGSLAVLSRPKSLLTPWILAALVLLDLYVAKDPMAFNHPTDPSVYTTPRPSISNLQRLPAGRMLSLAGEQYSLRDEAELRSSLASLSRPEVDEYLGYTRLKEIAAPNVGMSFGLSSVDGYDGGLLPTRRFQGLKGVLLRPVMPKPDLTMRVEATGVPESRLLGAFGVSYLLVNGATGGYDPGWREVAPGSGEAVHLLRNSAALPRAFVVHTALIASSDEEALAAVGSADLSRTVVLEGPVNYSQPSEPGKDQVTLANDGANNVTVDVTLEQAGFLVLSDSYYPGWEAHVDREKVELLRANYAVRAVQLEPGSHRVHFAYEPLSFRLGLAVSILGVIGLAAVGAIGYQRSAVSRRLPAERRNSMPATDA